MLGAAIVVLTSCTQSEVLDMAQSKAIGFSTFVEKPTKAVDDITNDINTGFKEFYVFGAKGTKNANGVFTSDETISYYLNDVKVTGGKEHWTYTPQMPWVAYKTFRFAAYANGKGDGTATVAKLNNVEFVPQEQSSGANANVWGLNINDYTVSDKDLIVAVPQEKTVGELTTSPGSVGVIFKHALAKIIFQFTVNNLSDDTQLQIKQFSFKAAGQGDCQVRYTGALEDNNSNGASWINNVYGDTNTKDFVFFKNDHICTAGNNLDAVYVIPQSNSGRIVGNITINTLNADDEVIGTHEYKNISLTISGHTEWKPGYVYRYEANLTPGQQYISFTSSVVTWEDYDNRNQTIF